MATPMSAAPAPMTMTSASSSCLEASGGGGLNLGQGVSVYRSFTNDDFLRLNLFQGYRDLEFTQARALDLCSMEPLSLSPDDMGPAIIIPGVECLPSPLAPL